MSISIVIPSYNSGKYIEETIKSILNQSYKDFEVIVQDNKSTDNTLQILSKYRPDVMAISCKDNGQPDAINKGIELTNGSIIAYICADDTYEPECFEIVARYFEEHPEVWWLYGKAKIIDSEDKEVRSIVTKAKELLQPRYGYSSLLCADYIVQPTVFIRRQLWEEIRMFNSDLKYCFDYEYWLRAGSINKPAYIDKHLANWRAHGESISVKGYKEEARQALRVQRMYSGNRVWLLPMQWLVYVGTVGLYWMLKECAKREDEDSNN